jgi:CcmD family protein
MKETFLVFAYMAIWIGLSGYLVSLAYRQKKLAAKIEMLNRQLKARQGQE